MSSVFASGQTICQAGDVKAGDVKQTIMWADDNRSRRSLNGRRQRLPHSTNDNKNEDNTESLSLCVCVCVCVCVWKN